VYACQRRTIIDILRVDLQPIAAPAHTFGCDHAGATAKESIENDVTAGGTVQDGVSDQPYGLDCRVQGEQVAFVTGSAGARVTPDISAIAPILAEKYIVAVRGAAGGIAEKCGNREKAM
jgi:uncharacterized protein involved in type VI secretion and phage assembly